jgi:hypothetical protein
MKENRNLHMRVQEMCDCFATTDPLEEMARMAGEKDDLQESAVKWLALAILHGVNSNAEEIVLRRGEDGRVRVKAEYRTADLPVPDQGIAEAVIEAVRSITHIEEDKGKLPVSIGIRDSSVDLEIRIKARGGKQKVNLKFR